MSHPTPKSAILSTISGLSWGGVYGGHKSCSRDDFYVFVCVMSDRGLAPGFFRRRPAGLEKQNLVTVSEIEAPGRLRGHKEAKVDESFRFSRFGNQKLTTVLDSRASGSKS